MIFSRFAFNTPNSHPKRITPQTGYNTRNNRETHSHEESACYAVINSLHICLLFGKFYSFFIYVFVEFGSGRSIKLRSVSPPEIRFTGA